MKIHNDYNNQTKYKIKLCIYRRAPLFEGYKFRGFHGFWGHPRNLKISGNPIVTWIAD